VIEVNDNGAHGIISLGDGSTKTVKQLVPFVKEAVQNVDLPNKLISLDWQPDW
jgi:16S rRNA processing protein RimM